MNNTSNKFRDWIFRTMQGRYGSDELSRFTSFILIIFIIVSLFVRIPFSNVITLVGLVFIYFRTFSRNIPARYRENRKFLELRRKLIGNKSVSARIRELKQYHIYKCPECGQKIRIPRGKGNIMVRCPKCSAEFKKRS